VNDTVAGDVVVGVVLPLYGGLTHVIAVEFRYVAFTSIL
jgi:hypothetical protein